MIPFLGAAARIGSATAALSTSATPGALSPPLSWSEGRGRCGGFTAWVAARLHGKEERRVLDRCCIRRLPSAAKSWHQVARPL
jgi:hypothetical protein